MIVVAPHILFFVIIQQQKTATRGKEMTEKFCEVRSLKVDGPLDDEGVKDKSQLNDHPPPQVSAVSPGSENASLSNVALPRATPHLSTVTTPTANGPIGSSSNDERSVILNQQPVITSPDSLSSLSLVASQVFLPPVFANNMKITVAGGEGTALESPNESGRDLGVPQAAPTNGPATAVDFIAATLKYATTVASSGIGTLDPLSTKLYVPLRFLEKTKGMRKSTTPSVCQLFLSEDKTCRQHAKCHQTHVSREFISAARNVATGGGTFGPPSTLCCWHHLTATGCLRVTHVQEGTSPHSQQGGDMAAPSEETAGAHQPRPHSPDPAALSSPPGCLSPTAIFVRPPSTNLQLPRLDPESVHVPSRDGGHPLDKPQIILPSYFLSVPLKRVTTSNEHPVQLQQQGECSDPERVPDGGIFVGINPVTLFRMLSSAWETSCLPHHNNSESPSAHGVCDQRCVDQKPQESKLPPLPELNLIATAGNPAVATTSSTTGSFHAHHHHHCNKQLEKACNKVELSGILISGDAAVTPPAEMLVTKGLLDLVAAHLRGAHHAPSANEQQPNPLESIFYDVALDELCSGQPPTQPLPNNSSNVVLDQAANDKFVIPVALSQVCRLHLDGPCCRFGDECRFLHVCPQKRRQTAEQSDGSTKVNYTPSSSTSSGEDKINGIAPHEQDFHHQQGEGDRRVHHGHRRHQKKNGGDSKETWRHCPYRNAFAKQYLRTTGTAPVDESRGENKLPASPNRSACAPDGRLPLPKSSVSLTDT